MSKIKKFLRKAADKLKERNRQIEESARTTPGKIRKEITFYEDGFFWGSPNTGNNWD